VSLVYIVRKSYVTEINMLNKNDFVKWVNKNYVENFGTIAQ